MKKSLNINAGIALLLDECSDAFTGYDNVSLNAGNVVISRKLNDKLSGTGFVINSGNTSVIDVSGKVVELGSKTVITASESYDGCYVVCPGLLIIESIDGLAGITGLYADTIFHPESVDLSTVNGILASRKIAYPDGAKLRLEDLTIDAESALYMDNSLYWVYGTITAIENDALENLRSKEAAFRCKSLIVRTGLFDKFGDMFKAESFLLVPDDHAYADEITLNAATSTLYSDKLFVAGDMLIQHDQIQHLSGFASLIVKGTVTMPVSAAKDFKSCGKAEDFDLYEGVLITINGDETISHEQLQKACELGIRYTLKVNGEVAFLEGVTAEDTEAIAAIHCNGVVYAPGAARSILDGKVKSLNGEVLDISEYGNEAGSKSDAGPGDDCEDSSINTGIYRLK